VFQAHRRAPGRPWPLTVLCLGCGLLLLITLWHAKDGGPARAFGKGYWAYLSTTSGALLVALWGVWRMRRWALWAFPLALGLDAVVVGAMGELRPSVLAVEAGLVLVLLAHFRAFLRT
jgi:hypothetical protein